MACKDLHTTINDVPVYARQWPAAKALTMLSQLLTMYGNRLSGFVEGEWELKDCVSLLYTADKNHAEVVALLREVCSAARINGKEIKTSQDFDLEFNGDLRRVFSIFAFVLELNFKDFFVDGATQQSETEVKSTSSPQETTTI